MSGTYRTTKLRIVLIILFMVHIDAQSLSKEASSQNDRKYVHGVFTYIEEYTGRGRVIPTMKDPYILPYLSRVETSQPFVMMLDRRINITNQQFSYLYIEFQAQPVPKNFKLHVGYLVVEKLYNIQFFVDVALRPSEPKHTWVSIFYNSSNVKYLPFVTGFTYSNYTSILVTQTPNPFNPNYTIALSNTTGMRESEFIEITMVAVNLDDKMCNGVDASSREFVKLPYKQTKYSKIIQMEGVVIVGLSSLEYKSVNFSFDQTTKNLSAFGMSFFYYNSLSITVFCNLIDNPAATNTGTDDKVNKTYINRKRSPMPRNSTAWGQHQGYLWTLSLILLSEILPACQSNSTRKHKSLGQAR